MSRRRTTRLLEMCRKPNDVNLYAHDSSEDEGTSITSDIITLENVESLVIETIPDASCLF